MMAEERRRIARSVAAIRGDWTVEHVDDVIRLHLTNHPYRDVSVALVAVAHIERSRPERVLDKGPWWKAVEQLGGTAPVTAQRHPECAEHKHCPEHTFHPVDPKECPDCRTRVVLDRARIHELAEQAKAELKPAPHAAQPKYLVGPPGSDAVHVDAVRKAADLEAARRRA
jgi:hypothetical protein